MVSSTQRLTVQEVAQRGLLAKWELYIQERRWSDYRNISVLHEEVAAFPSQKMLFFLLSVGAKPPAQRSLEFTRFPSVPGLDSLMVWLNFFSQSQGLFIISIHDLLPELLHGFFLLLFFFPFFFIDEAISPQGGSGCSTSTTAVQRQNGLQSLCQVDKTVAILIRAHTPLSGANYIHFSCTDNKFILHLYCIIKYTV